MESYRQLALRYLRANRVRSILTIIGVAVTVAALYAGLNIAYSRLLNMRDEVRETSDYDFIIMAEGRAEAEKVAADELITKAYIGSYEYVSDEGSVLYDNALYASCKHSWQMKKVMDKLTEKYGVSGELNEALANLYIQADMSDDSAGVFAVVIFVLLVAYIFAIFAVGIIRNSVQMFMLEQVRDYGILRCVGATKGQLKSVIWRMGFALEMAGIIAGALLGGIASVLYGVVKNTNTSFHLLPLLPVLICYLGDLVFVMNDTGKLVLTMPPIDAVRGQFRIKLEKIKSRGRGIMGRLFGIEGEYARKTVMRNKGRFAKTVASVSFSMAALIAVGGMTGTLNSVFDYIDAVSGPYQLQYTGEVNAFTTVDAVEADLPSVEAFQNIARNDAVKAARKVYSATVKIADRDEFVDKIADGYLYPEDDWLNTTYSVTVDMYKSGNAYAPVLDSWSDAELMGVTDDELAELGGELVDGSTELGDDGILVVVSGSYVYFADDELGSEQLRHINMYTYEVGDTIDIVDTEEYYRRTQEKIAEIEASGDAEGNIYMYEAAAEVYDDMVKSGKYKTYVVKGIIDIGDETPNMERLSMYTSLDNYLAETGFDENQISGMKYKIDSAKLSPSDVSEMLYDNEADYLYSMLELVSLRSMNRYIVMAAIFIFTISAVNIVNSTIGNLHMRRKEFAQLRVIGMSKGRLTRTAMLEGVMALVPATIIGTATGFAVHYLEHYYLSMMYPHRFVPAVGWVAAGFAVAFVLIVGSIYVPMRRLPKQMAEDLTLEE